MNFWTRMPITRSSVTIRKVTVAGITGAIGLEILEALHNAGFQAQALTRTSSLAKSVHRDIKVIAVDYTKPDDLREALAGQDAVVSALGDTPGAVAAQEALIEASVAVGVKRFIPSEFGSDTMNERVRSFPFFADKLRHQELLQKATLENSGFSYTFIITGPFLDWGLRVVPFIINVGTQSAEVFDGGDVPFSTTRITTLSKAIVSTLQNFRATANRTLRIHDALITQNQLIACHQRLTSNVEFHSIPVDCRILEKEAWKRFQHSSSDPPSWILPFINVSIWSSEALCAFRQTDNKLLGIKQINGPGVDDMLHHEVALAIEAFSPSDSLRPSSFCRDLAEKAFEDGKQKLAHCQSK